MLDASLDLHRAVYYPTPMRRRWKGKQRTIQTGVMWVHGSYSDYYEHQRALPPPGAVLLDEGVYALASARVAVSNTDGVAPVPGRDSLQRNRASYRATGVVSSAIRPIETATSQEFLLVAGAARLITRTSLAPKDQVKVGERITLECIFELVASYDWSVFDLPEEWSGDWRIEQIVQRGMSSPWDFVLDLNAIAPTG